MSVNNKAKEQKSILLADDNANIRYLFYEFMKISFPEYNVETFEDGIALKGRLEKNIDDIKIIITDNRMPPGNTGSEIIKDYAKQIPMILVYGGEKYIGEKAIENGAVGYLLKPIYLQKLAEIVKRVLSP
ncbi:MAG: response regulator [Nanoarchaeota archaeon]|nr:response regulator [Nanoarchaeota archaeon]MBU4116125.1 response regulator [Nanoarchaeota archaeon]